METATIEEIRSTLMKHCHGLDGFLGTALIEGRIIALIDKLKPQVRDQIPRLWNGLAIGIMPADVDCLHKLVGRSIRNRKKKKEE